MSTQTSLQSIYISTLQCRGLVRLFETSVESTMKIAQIASLIESVPPRFYGGTERVVSYLTEELVRVLAAT